MAAKQICLGKPQKKGQPLRKNYFFKFFFFKFCCNFKIKIILYKTTCRNIDISRESLSIGILSGFCYNIFQKIGFFCSKNLGQKKNCQNPFPAILWLKKSSMAIKPQGGGVKALIARPLRDDIFFAASLSLVLHSEHSVCWKQWVFETNMILTDSVYTN